MPNRSQPQYLYLTTTGRRSGARREIEIWFTRRGRRYYVIAEYPTSHWVQNLRAIPQVAVRVGKRRFSATARMIDPLAEPELHAAVRQLSRDKYGWGDGLIVELKPEAPHH